MHAATPSLAHNSTDLCVDTEWPLTLSMLLVLLLPQKEPGGYMIGYLHSNHMTDGKPWICNRHTGTWHLFTLSF